jgi:regulator of sirC expression with transglutaminase-like and TPR domain
MVAMKRLALGSLAAVLAFGVVLAQVSDPDTVKRRAFALAQAGDYAQARTDLERLLAQTTFTRGNCSRGS